MSFRSVARTHPGAVRPCNEDAVLQRAEAGIWAVSDGMGGHAAGDVASALVIDSLMTLAPNGNNGTSMDAVRDTLARANGELYARGALVSPDHTMGATVTVLGTGARNFYCLWAGDSRLYRFRGGTLTRLTRDHRYVQALIDSGLLDEEAAEKHPRRSVILRAVGVDAELELDVCEGTIEPGDVFLLVTDGVSGVCRDDELTEILSGRGLEDAADRIVEQCLQRGAPDNLSLVLVAAAKD
ncbi:MAG TPA: protein phosphatase 2C domain-containing protein [Micropepsaceae bacterium]